MTTPETLTWKEKQEFSHSEASSYQSWKSNLVWEEVWWGKNNLIPEEKRREEDKPERVNEPEITPEQYSTQLSQNKLMVGNEVKNHEDWPPGKENPESARKLASKLESGINRVA